MRSATSGGTLLKAELASFQHELRRKLATSAAHWLFTYPGQSQRVRFQFKKHVEVAGA